MGKKNLLLIACTVFMILCSYVIRGQHGVLLPKKQVEHVHDENCNHDDDDACCSSGHDDESFIERGIAEGWLTLPTPDINPRRGDVSNPVPDYGKRDTIHGDRDVSVVFGAGESTIISGTHVVWPASPHPFPPQSGTDTAVAIVGGNRAPAILIGSAYSKNAVIGIYDFNGLASGALRDIRLYAGSGSGNPPEPAYNAAYFTLMDPLATAANAMTSPINLTIDASDAIPETTTSSPIPAPNVYQIRPPVNGIYVTAVNTVSYPAIQESSPGAVLLARANYLNGTDLACVGAILRPYYDPTDSRYYVPVWNHITMGRSGPPPQATNWDDSVLVQKQFYFDVVTADTLYTSTRNFLGKKDNDKPLLYTISDSYTPDTVNAYNQYRATLNTIDYIRPTTVLVSGPDNILDSIMVRDIEWYAAFLKATIKNPKIEGPFKATNNNNCAHLTGWVSYVRDSAVFDTIGPTQTTSSIPDAANHTGTHTLNRKVDAAVRILDNADVCVRFGLIDSTEVPYTLASPTSTNYNRDATNAILVLPGYPNTAGERSNFRLKIGGDAAILHTQDSNYYLGSNPLEDEMFYREATSPVSAESPGEPFPTALKEIYMSGSGIYGSTTTWVNEASGLKRDYLHPREPLTITNNSVGDEVPFVSTAASVYGVRGDYFGYTNIHTRDFAGEDTTNIIEFGPETNNQDFFKIYSGGMLKNFRGCTTALDSLLIGTTNTYTTFETAPGFRLSRNPDTTLYIVHDGDGIALSPSPGYSWGIRFNSVGTDSINAAIADAEGGGDLHIQANSFVRFIGSDLKFDLKKDNEIKVLSDLHSIFVENNVFFTKADSAHLTFWANGDADDMRGYTDVYDQANPTGAILIGGNVRIQYDTVPVNGRGLALFRSEHDDVLVNGSFNYMNQYALSESGELMVQAGQDIRVAGETNLLQDGQRSMLFEAYRTIAFGDNFTAIMGSRVPVTPTTDSIMTNGDLTIKAGYDVFLPTADVYGPTHPSTWDPPVPPGLNDPCVVDGYSNRTAIHSPRNTGGDIWFEKDVAITLTPDISDSVDVYIRAFNSIYVDGDYQHTLSSTNLFNSGDMVDTTLTYAETGNYEASGSGQVVFNFSANDSVYFLLQAGNTLGNPCGETYVCDRNDTQNKSPWHGNVLFGDDKAFTINHDGVGKTLVSASRDIENQEGANVTFNYTNVALSNDDSVTVTAGRHIETHAPYWFDFSQAGKSITNSITMQAGHQQAAGCLYDLCKAPELASNLAYNYTQPFYPIPPDTLSIFAKDGSGHGSILLFDSLKFDYAGTGNILMTALNGNIESDPYLHGDYKGGAPIIFNVDTAEGYVRMEAIDIKLHDILQYNGGAAMNDFKNGQYYLLARDSILTRSLFYTNKTDTGSVYIITDKYKATSTTCLESDYDTDQRGIHQGHIVLGYVSDCDNTNTKDSLVFDFSTNPNTVGANLYIRAGYLGYEVNSLTGRNTSMLTDYPDDRGKGYGGNITFDFMKINMAVGSSGKGGGYTEISTPNGNIWGKDSIQYHGINGDLRIDAGDGSIEDTRHAVRWSGFATANRYGAGTEDMLNTMVPLCCEDSAVWRTGNIMMKGGSVNFLDDLTGGSNLLGTGNVFFRTREGFIDVYDKFDALNMTGHLLVYAGMTPANTKKNEWGDVSERDFQYSPVVNSGSVYFGADDNIMLNYGYSNGFEASYNYSATNPGIYDVVGANLTRHGNPFYSSAFYSMDDCFSVFNVNKNGYLWYKNPINHPTRRQSHLLYRGCSPAPSTNQTSACFPLTGQCLTIDNGARPLMFNFNETSTQKILSGGLAVVASNYIDMFTAFTFEGGIGTGLHAVPEMNTLKGEIVEGYGLYIKSLFNGANPEKRRNTCFDCAAVDNYNWKEWPAITFHDDARILTEKQKSLIEAPVIEFFGHAVLDAERLKDINTTKLTVKADSLVFHDSVVFAGPLVELVSYTTDPDKRHATKESAMRFGVVNDDVDFRYYQAYGKAIQMPDRGTPILEFGYQRCYEPPYAPTPAPNRYSEGRGERTPMVGGDIIVAFKHDFALPIYNTIVANHARISFMDDMYDGVQGGEFVDTYIRTDLLRIRNKVEFYTDPDPSTFRLGTFRMTSNEQMPSVAATGIYPHHLHMEPGSELSLPGEDSLVVISTTTVGGYGEIHENIHVLADGIIAPGYASLMEHDCQTGYPQGKLTIHNLYMEKDAVMRISIGLNGLNCRYNPDTQTTDANCTQTDTLVVQDSIFFFGKIPLYVLTENQYVEPGCYLFLVYNDTDASVEYVNNLVLMTTTHEGLHFNLDKSERGRVYLCVTETPTPIIQRYIHIHEVEGVTTDPVAEVYHYVAGHDDFVFTATYANKTPLEVLATGYYSQKTTKLLATYVLDGTYQYKIRQVVEPYDVYFGDVDTSVGDVGNESLLGKRVWSYRNTLYVNADKADVLSIYSVTGVLYQKLEIPAGLQKLTLDRGVYMVMLKDGAVHKIIIN